jgi:hypothetical protein
MSSPRGPSARGEGTSGKRGPGNLKGSCNRKTLAALVAAIAPTATAATGAALALGGEDASEKRGSGRPKGSGKKVALAEAAAPSSPRCRGRPPGSKNKRTLAALGAAVSGPRKPPVAASPSAGPSRPQLALPARQPPAYTSAKGWSTFIVPMLAGAKDCLRLPSRFMEMMED